MKKQILSILFTLSFLISFSQLVSYESIWVKEDMNESYRGYLQDHQKMGILL